MAYLPTYDFINDNPTNIIKISNSLWSVSGKHGFLNINNIPLEISGHINRNLYKKENRISQSQLQLQVSVLK